ncbi:hypothetical protein HZH66_010025 [Vespula vulgaris]|uniref:Uncharacterized protein n=1 Tax=Vespula vulgaris TaxID=7454 RepID=A0A834JHN6_VESVU|nr:hypothetical protein HZH66_010025 [Vespula vulgaris]
MDAKARESVVTSGEGKIIFKVVDLEATSFPGGEVERCCPNKAASTSGKRIFAAMPVAVARVRGGEGGGGGGGDGGGGSGGGGGDGGRDRDGEARGENQRVVFEAGFNTGTMPVA